MEPRGRDRGMSVANKAFQKVDRDRGRAGPTCVLFSGSFVFMCDGTQNNSILLQPKELVASRGAVRYAEFTADYDKRISGIHPGNGWSQGRC